MGPGPKWLGCSLASSASTDTTAAPHRAWHPGPAPHSHPRLHSPMGPKSPWPNPPWRRLGSRDCQGLLLVTLGPAPRWQLGPGPIPHTWLARQPLPPTRPRHSGQLFHLCSPWPPCPTRLLRMRGPAGAGPGAEHQVGGEAQARPWTAAPTRPSSLGGRPGPTWLAPSHQKEPTMELPILQLTLLRADNTPLLSLQTPSMAQLPQGSPRASPSQPVRRLTFHAAHRPCPRRHNPLRSPRTGNG